jgi:hypothetical protein
MKKFLIKKKFIKSNKNQPKAIKKNKKNCKQMAHIRFYKKYTKKQNKKLDFLNLTFLKQQIPDIVQFPILQYIPLKKKN